MKHTLVHVNQDSAVVVGVVLAELGSSAGNLKFILILIIFSNSQFKTTYYIILKI